MDGLVRLQKRRTRKGQTDYREFKLSQLDVEIRKKREAKSKRRVMSLQEFKLQMLQDRGLLSGN